jgi:hypothetical protein
VVDVLEMTINDPAFDLVLNDLQESFVRKLSDADLESLTTDLERIAFAGS